jgi:hypothetical protein
LRSKSIYFVSCFRSGFLRLMAYLVVTAGCAASLPAEEAAKGEGTIFITEYRVAGVRKLPRLAVEEAVYPYLGPGRTRDDIEAARAALEAAYQTNGFRRSRWPMASSCCRWWNARSAG